MTADSPYAAELARLQPGRRFRPVVESEYLDNQLLSARTLIRTAAVLALLLVLVRAGIQLIAGRASGLLLVDLSLVFTGSVALLWLAWSAAFTRLYLPWAEVIVPIRNTIAAAHFAGAAAHGEPELLMLLPLMLIGPFFFLALRLRIALLSGALSTAAFLLCALRYGLETAVIVRSALFLLVGLIACALAGRQLEKHSRKAFLAGRVMAELAQRDALTGTKNRRVFDEHLAQIWRQASAAGVGIAVLLIDVDHFKAYNDRYGHLAGDDALQAVARAAQRFVHRQLDVLARYGGEEFAVVLYDVGAQQARGIADEMRRAVVALDIEHQSSRTEPAVTISIGVAAIRPDADRDCRGLLQLADQALYQAKLKGRNRVELMGEEHYRSLETGVFRSTAERATA
jgi:diguanylate cyclase (GGDEF)-like protein